MKNLIVAVIRNFFAITIAFSIFVALILAGIISIVGLTHTQPTTIKKNAILVIDLDEPISDAPASLSAESLIPSLFSHSSPHSFHLLQVLEAIKTAETDPRIMGIALKSPSSTTHHASLTVFSEIRSALEHYKNSGKPIIAHLSISSAPDLFLASIANTILIDPFGELTFAGLSSEYTFYADALKKYGIGVQTTQVGRYKSGNEPYTRTSLSDAEREQMTDILNHTWDYLLGSLSDTRNISKDKLQSLAGSQGLFLPAQAKKSGLVDDIAYFDQLPKYFNLLLNPDIPEDLYSKVSLHDYIHSETTLPLPDTSVPRVAVVYVNGDIVSGTSLPGEVGAQTLISYLDSVLDDANIEALVVRVNSPGGAATPSDEILRKIQRIQQHIPVVASFGEYAASGAYWMSCSSDAIFSDSLTITGSIGVYSHSFTFDKIANEHGITFDSISTSPLAGFHSPFMALTDAQLDKLQESTNYTYNLFIHKVAHGRGMQKTEVNALAGGRAWLGAQAQSNGLVDHLGTLQDAIDHAASLAKLDTYDIKQFPESDPLSLEALTSLFNFDISSWIQQSAPPTSSSPIQNSLSPIAHLLRKFNDPHHAYARFPYNMRIY